MSVSKTQPMRPGLIDAIDEINGLDSNVSDLETVIGDNSAGLVKAVSDLETVVGDNSAGLVKDVSDLETTVGDNSAGLVKDVTDLKNHVPVSLIASNMALAVDTITQMPAISDDYNFLLFLTYTSDGTRNTSIVPNSNVIIPVNSATHNNSINWKKTTGEIITPDTNSETVNIRWVYGLKL